jgi:hypothetical protein
MATKANFTPDEWKSLLQSPLLVGIAVSAADPSSLFGMLKESMASARALVEAKTDPNSDELVKAVASDFETSEGRGQAQDGLKALFGASKPGDIAAKTADALRAVANAVAEAAPEGGFLGFGGTQVSEAEKASVAQIATALGVSVPAGT